ncbi:MAG: DUF1145 domain-containing protein [Nitrospirae bacterium]|nr:MAG: DUF1145 domain-containing protein [Nitrospirota bacterium]
MSLPKVAVLVGWAVMAAGFLAPEGSLLARAGPPLLGATAAIHALEVLVFRERIRRGRGGPLRHVLGTLVFGFFHVREIEA